MKIICSWCRGEGHHGIVGEKAPLEDHRETHGICKTHRLAVQARWHDLVVGSARIDQQHVSVGSESEGASSGGGGHFALSAATLWVGIKNLTRKAGL